MLPRVKIIQVGDIHLPSAAGGASAVDNKDGRFPIELRNVISAHPIKLVFREIYRLLERGGISAALFMGDLTDIGDVKGYQACAKYIARSLQFGAGGVFSNLPVGFVPGNHDIDRNLAKQAGLTTKFEPLVAALSAAGLGHYTSALQSNPDDPTVLGRAERGVFSVRFGAAEKAYPGDVTPDREGLVWRTIRQAEIAGYIRTADLRLGDGADSHEILDHRGRVITFRLHRRFAPQFRFSYRGAYEAIVIAPLDLWPLCDPAVPADPKLWAEQMSKRVSSFDAQLSLRFSPDESDE